MIQTLCCCSTIRSGTRLDRLRTPRCSQRMGTSVSRFRPDRTRPPKPCAQKRLKRSTAFSADWGTWHECERFRKWLVEQDVARPRNHQLWKVAEGDVSGAVPTCCEIIERPPTRYVSMPWPIIAVAAACGCLTSRKLKPSQNARAGPEARRPASEGAPARRTPPEVALKHGDSSARAGSARRACSAGASICKQTHLHTDGHGATGNEFPTR